MVFYYLSLILLAVVNGHTTMFDEDMAIHGYPYDSHRVVTEDKYVLTLFRIQGKINKKIMDGKQPILLVHGLDESAHGWIINDAERSLALVLADRGYDVWLLNNRGTIYSRLHMEHKIDSKEMWDFSFQELAEHDVVASINLITRKTDGKQIIAIGHSQGAAQIVAAMADPKISALVQDRLLGLIGLSPVTQISDVHYRSQLLYDMISIYVKVHNAIGLNYPFLSSSTQTLYKKTMSVACNYMPMFCEGVLAIPGMGLSNNRKELVGKVMQVFPGGASFRCYLHFEQLSRISGSDQPVLKKYDFGSEDENLKRYGQIDPPHYDYSLIKKPIMIHSGNDDILVTPESMKRFERFMKSQGKDVTLRLYDSWDHFSILTGIDPQPVFSKILDDIETLEKSKHRVPTLADQD